eukprot:tig00000983_g5893.t1
MEIRAAGAPADSRQDEGDGPVGLDSKVLNAAGVVQAKVRAQLCPAFQISSLTALFLRRRSRSRSKAGRLGLESRRAPGSGMGLARGAELLDGVGRSSARGPGAGPRRT